MSQVDSPRRRDLWLTRLYYFVMLGGSGFIQPFLNLYYTRVGLSGTSIGIITATGAIISLVVAPMWTNASQHHQHPRRLLQLALILTALFYLLLGMQTVFWGILMVAALRALVSAGISPISDALTLSVTHASKSGFGSVRVWASMGWIIVTLLGGGLIEQTGFSSAFIGVTVVTFAGAFILIPITPHYFSRKTSGQLPLGIIATLRRVLTNRAMLGLMAMLTIIGIMNNGVGQFETVYLNTLGAKETMLGIAGVMSAIVEIPCMLWADRLTHQRGARKLLLISMLMMGFVRLMVFIAPSIGMILAERALSGVAFSVYTVALIGYINEQSSPQETGTVLALYTVTLANLVGIIAAPLSGIAYDAFGARWLYAFAIVGYGLGWFALYITKQTKTGTSAE